jgi:hypothetical protein
VKSSVSLGTKPLPRTTCSALDNSDAATEVDGAAVAGVVAGVVGVVGADPFRAVVWAFDLGRDVVVTCRRAVANRATFGCEIEVEVEVDAAGAPVVDEAAAFDEPDELQLHSASAATQRNAERAIVRAEPPRLPLIQFVTARRLPPGAVVIDVNPPSSAIGTTLANFPRHHAPQSEPSRLNDVPGHDR